MNDKDAAQDREIARHFSSLRVADVRLAPAIPDAQALAQRSPLVTETRPSPVVARVAAGVVLALFAGFLALDKSPQDPGAVYADIMGDNYLMTDSLMSVSVELSPEMIDTMGALDMTVLELN